MAFTFPASPATNDTYTVGSRTYTWTGSVWEMTGGLITTSQLTDLGVTTAKINDAAVTQAKLGTTLSAVTVTTTANRDTAVASPFTGQLVFLTDTKKVQVWDGASWLNITLAPPETPTSLSATALGTTSVSIAFTAGGANGSPITNYKYALSTNGGSTYGSFTALSPEDITTPITISGLTEATAYYIKLKAVNDMGDSVASSAVTITTLDTPDAPTSLSAGSITTTTAAISFTPGAQGGSAISNYQYALSTNGGSTYGSFTALSPADATSPITITGLTAGSAYYVKIKAVNNDGAGAESSAVSFTTLFTADFLVIAGGGGGGTNIGGGGGAGGYRTSLGTSGRGASAESVYTVPSSFTVTVGGGGAASSGSTGGSGVNSVLGSITSVGGGGGGNYSGVNGVSGGAGGGSGPNVSAGAGTSAQGYDGGAATSAGSGNWRAGGGGGAGSAGSGGTGAGNGGSGQTNSITTSSVTRAGGGGGGGFDGGAAGSGGSGGAGGGGYTGAWGGNGSGNTGSGGGGSGNYPGDYAGAGGSGIVIFRYSDTIADLSSIGAGLTYTKTVTGGYKIYAFTLGTGLVTV